MSYASLDLDICQLAYLCFIDDMIEIRIYLHVLGIV